MRKSRREQYATTSTDKQNTPWLDAAADTVAACFDTASNTSSEYSEECRTATGTYATAHSESDTSPCFYAEAILCAAANDADHTSSGTETDPSSTACDAVYTFTYSTHAASCTTTDTTTTSVQYAGHYSPRRGQYP